jgi:hypothetical protein
MTLRLVLPVVAALVAACASGGGGGAARTDGPTTRQRSPNVITAEEIQEQPSPTLYDVVRALRPAWLLARRPTTIMRQQEGPLVVYLDGTRYGTLESLRQLRPGGVRMVRYFSPTEAQARFGPGHLQGAIEVTTSGN